MNEAEFKDFKAWFNHSNWEPHDRLGDVGAAMLNQMPKLLEVIEAHKLAPLKLEAEKKLSAQLVDDLEKAIGRSSFFEKDCETKREVIRFLQKRCKVAETAAVVSVVIAALSVGAFFLK